MLEGKAQDKFEEWLIKWLIENGLKFQSKRALVYFNDLPNEFQWGVFQDWADSLGYHMETVLEEWGFDMSETIHVTSFRIGIHESETNYDTRPQAREAAINKLNTLINEG